jgi:hypothetical protein
MFMELNSGNLELFPDKKRFVQYKDDKFSAKSLLTVRKCDVDFDKKKQECV